MKQEIEKKIEFIENMLKGTGVEFPWGTANDGDAYLFIRDYMPLALQKKKFPQWDPESGISLEQCKKISLIEKHTFETFNWVSGMVWDADLFIRKFYPAIQCMLEEFDELVTEYNNNNK